MFYTFILKGILMRYIVHAQMGGNKKKFIFFDKTKAIIYANDLPSYGYTKISIQSQEAQPTVKKNIKIIKG
jgi:GTP-binding protein EngB required for normal cell division